MTINTRLTDPDGRPAVLITAPIPGRLIPYGVIMYDSGRAVVIDLRSCKPAPPVA